MRHWIKGLERRIALRYLNRTRNEHLAKFPQVATYAFDFIGNSISVDGRYEGSHLDVLERHVFPKLRGTSALDIGANIGNHALAFAPFFTHVFAFEPNDRVFQLLTVNARLVANITIFNVGLSDRVESGELHFTPSNLGGASRSTRTEMALQTFHATFTTIDSLSEIASQKIGLIKIDVEGEELRVLRGGARIIARDHPVVLFEVLGSSEYQKEAGLNAFLREMGYEYFYEVAGDRGPAGPKRSADALKRINQMEHRFYQMVIASSADLLEKIDD